MGGGLFRYIYCIIFWWISLPLDGWTQSSEADVFNQLKATSSDTVKLRLYNTLSRLYWAKKDTHQLKTYTLAALRVADTTQQSMQLGQTFHNACHYYRLKTLYPKAIEYAQKARAVFQSIAYTKGVGNVYNTLGEMYQDQGKYTKAIDCHFNALRIAEKSKNAQMISASLSNIAAIYETIEQYDKALEYFEKALKIDQKRKAIESIGLTQVNIAQVYYHQKKYAQAKKYARWSIQNARKAKVPLIEGVALKFLAMLQSFAQDTLNATANFEKSHQLMSTQDQAPEYVALLLQMSRHYLQYKQLEKAKKYGKIALTKSLRIGTKKETKGIYKVLSSIYEQQGKLAQALEYQKKYAAYKDSLLTIKANNKLIQHELEYMYSKKEAKIKSDNHRQINQQSIYLYIISFGLLTVSLFSFFLLKSSRKQNTLNQELKEQQQELKAVNKHLQQKQTEIESNNQELKFLNHRLKSGESVITKAYDQLQTRNKQIKNNIRAAFTIQQAMLPPVALVRQLLPEHFIIYQPKDIVSGDFYWINEIEGKIIVIFADCTGHGVQGAFMSLIGHNLLDKLILQQRNTDPASILTQLNEQVLTALHQQDARSIDGMDIGILVLGKTTEGQKQLVYAGAKRPLYYLRPNNHEEIQVLKGVRKSIGGTQAKNKSFVNHQLALPTGSMLYMGTDGLADQHDYQRKKLGSLRLRNILTELHTLPIEEQETSLFALIQRHMLNTEQRDDILWIGIRV
ncbi:tetratricopeptide repeat protein [Microscilla marina]|uniref:Serine/threonine protein kinases, putative n=1 Tax=Microscilla marina ATCC 23134 TaxID=313606 RepID=A1ZF23_MICM2|nr:tetratricopeptide repeat protein [Microscilla marina]EAY31125.1 serine/threonine protein kinases, putative [Microscilla marina ATCC 23134]